MILAFNLLKASLDKQTSSTSVVKVAGKMDIKFRSGSIGNTSDLEVYEKDNATNRYEVKKTIRELVKECLVEYTETTNLHGLKYIGEKKRSTVEKLFWVFVFTCSLIMCAMVIRNVWTKWNERPVIVSFAETSTPVWQIPYPAVTVCFETKSMPTIFNYTHYYQEKSMGETNFTENVTRMFNDISLLCFPEYNYTEIGDNHPNFSASLENIKKVFVDMNNIFDGCGWKNKPIDCDSLFSPILTDEGICHTFNTLGANEILRAQNVNTDYKYLENVNQSHSWSLEKGYDHTTPADTYPRRGTGNGARAGLIFYMTFKPEELDYICNGAGIKILLHSPDELPRLSEQYFRVPLSQEIVFAVRPKMMTTSEGLRSYKPSRRQCYFSDDLYLRYFKVYSQGNCELECLTNYTFARCGCVHFSMPHSPDMPVCRTSDYPCITEAQLELRDIEINHGLSKHNGLRKRRNDKSKMKNFFGVSHCKCKPACTSVKYEAEISQSDFDWKNIAKAYNISDDDNYRVSSVTIYFKEAQFITSRRSELYGVTDFIANCGGLLGLFLGFSILSVAEIVYFATLRLWCLLRKSRQAKVHSKKAPAITILDNKQNIE